ncbi:MAG: RsmF rRNA methyltransferase first C-terminal domain-containing protein [Lachnospiraceae bacterium]
MKVELPALFKEHMQELLGEEYEDYLKSYEEPRLYGLRVNTSKISVEEFVKKSPFKLRTIPWISNGFYYNGSEKPAKHPYYFAGLYYLQEPSAMTPANVLPIREGDRVLDICAAPGGKSTELAAKLKGTGVLVSNDISNSRAKALLKNLELFGIPNSVILSESPYRLAAKFPEYFDKILIDAPCSGEGMFRKDPSVMKNWSESSNETFSKLQREIVTYALQMLKPGGMLVYSTCTFHGSENEQTVQYMLDLCPELKILEIPAYEGFEKGRPELAGGNPELAKCVRIFPHKMQGEGHFVALLQKSGEQKTPSIGYTGHNRWKNEELEAFLKKVKMPLERSRIEIRSDRASLLPDADMNLDGLRILRNGLLLGECKKSRFEPSQALAMALSMEEYEDCVNFSCEDERVIRYLKGETIEAQQEAKSMRGWVLVCVDGAPLGFAKAANGVLKNKYLAGWRWL